MLAEADRHNITVVQMLAPTSTSERIDLVSKLAEGFIYCVSVTGVTGARDTLSDTLAAFFEKSASPDGDFADGRFRHLLSGTSRSGRPGG